MVKKWVHVFGSLISAAGISPRGVNVQRIVNWCLLLVSVVNFPHRSIFKTRCKSVPSDLTGLTLSTKVTLTLWVTLASSLMRGTPELHYGDIFTASVSSLWLLFVSWGLRYFCICCSSPELHPLPSPERLLSVEPASAELADERLYFIYCSVFKTLKMVFKFAAFLDGCLSCFLTFLPFGL